MRSTISRLTLATLLAGVGACSADSPPAGSPGLAIAVAPLSFPGITDATYTVTVRSAHGPVWTRQLTSRGYGDGSGAISYVGPCDASPGANPHTIELVIDGLAAGAPLTEGEDWFNPAPAGTPLTRSASCVSQGDVPVQFDVTVMRAGGQGFFDIAVSFDDVFCSAKLDCADDDGPLELLFNPHTGERDRTIVLGLSCTTGAGSATILHMQDVELACGGVVATVDVAGGPGNLNPPFIGPPNTTDLLFQAAVYRERQPLGGVAFWNVALGLNQAALPGLGACHLTGRATVTPAPLPDGELRGDGVYPWIAWDVPVTTGDAANAVSCTHYPLGSAEVAPRYHRPSDPPLGFSATWDPAGDDVERHAILLAQSHAGGLLEAGDRFGAVIALGDFDGDTYADAALAAVGEDALAGAISVFAGSGAGFAKRGLTFDESDLGGSAEAGAVAGSALAAGDLDGDGYDDLVVGVPAKTGERGLVYVIPGSAAGLQLGAATALTRAGAGCGAAAAGDRFGEALAIGDFDGDGALDLAIGLPGASAARGAICVVAGGASGAPTGGKVWSNGRGALTSGAAADGDRYGATLLAGRFDGDGATDLAVGAPGAANGGAVEVLFGQTAGAFFGRGVTLTQANAGGTGVAGERFGAALARGDVDGDGAAELVVGCPDDLFAGVALGGVYTFFGPVAPGNVRNTAALPQTVAPTALHEAGGHFGAALAVIDTNGDGFAEIIVGAPDADGGFGRFSVLPGSATGAGPGASFDATSLALLPTGTDRVGAALAAADLDRDGFGDLVIGAPGAAPSRVSAGQAVVVPGAGDAPSVCGTCPYTSQVCVRGGCAFDTRRQARSAYPHTVDGRLTGWSASPPPPTFEWYDISPLPGAISDLRVDYDGARLHLLDDVHGRAVLADGCYEQLTVTTDGGLNTWQVKVFTSGPPQVFKNGDPVAPGAAGVSAAHTAAASPGHLTAHPLFELALPAGPGAFSVAVAHPGPAGSCERLTPGAAGLVGAALAGGGVDVAKNSDVPWIVGLNGPRGQGATFGVVGVALGESGAASLGSRPAKVVDWTPACATLQGPVKATAAGVFLHPAGAAATNTARYADKAGAAALNPTSDEAHQVDGHMTGWAPSASAWEWRGVVPVPVGSARVYADYDGAALHLLVDWPSAPTGPLRLRGWTGGGGGLVGGPGAARAEYDGAGLVQWEIALDGGAVTVTRDGEVVGDLAAAGVAVAVSADATTPDGASPHTAWELALPTGPLGFGFQVGADARVVQGVADPKGGLYVQAAATPVLLGMSPLRAAVGETVTLTGVNLGAGGGHLTLGGNTTVTPTSWTDTAITFVAPAGVDTGLVRAVYDGGGRSNALALSVRCAVGGDCASGICVAGECEAASCLDGVQNGDETAIDCGGSCGGCAAGLSCGGAGDCESLVCTASVCAAPSCGDGVRNQDETAIDCGGATCGPCSAGKSCGVASDCASRVCTAGACKTATCYDGVKNQNETDVDCGGSCGRCATGRACGVTGDCAYGTCAGGTCVCTPQCSGKVCGSDGCGGSCGGCPGVQTCQQSGTVCDFVYTVVPKSGYPHTVDGEFTGWSADDPPTRFEWYDIPPAQGQYTNAYFDYAGGRLHMLNDWFYNDTATIDPTCYNLFIAYTGDGAQRWQVKVYADQHVEVFLNGAPFEATNGGPNGAEGGYGFVASPRVSDREHTIYELSLPALPGRFALQLHDPGPTSGCAVLEREPTTFVGVANSGGGLKLAANPDVPWLPGANPSSGPVGTVVEVYGVGLGDTPGTVTFGGVPATVDSWSDAGLRVRVPAGANDTGIQVTVPVGWKSNLLPFKVVGAAQEPGAVANPPSRVGYTIDGQFTGWSPDTADVYEWQDIVPATGDLTYIYSDYDGFYLYLANDWHANDAATVAPECYSHYRVYTADGDEHWDIKVFGDETVEAKLNGELVDASASGIEAAVMFRDSPLVPFDHTIFELKLPASPGAWGVQLRDPGNAGGGGTCAGAMLVEPSNLRGRLDPMGGGWIVASTQPTLYGLSPAKAAAGDTLVIYGARLGAAAGKVTFPGLAPVTPVSWTSDAVTVTVPAGFSTGRVSVTPSGGVATNGLLLRLICHDGGDCESGVCVDETCQLPTCVDEVDNGAETDVDCGGGVCPRCGDGASCALATDCVSGRCVSGTCQVASCGDGVKNGTESDVDCGGACGACGYGLACLSATDCASGRCDAGFCRPTAQASATGDPTPIGSFERDVRVVIRVTDLGGAAISKARVEVPQGWLIGAIGAGGVTARLASGADITSKLSRGAEGAAEHQGTLFTLTGLALAQAGAEPYAEIVFDGVQAQEQTGQSRWYVDVDEGLGFGRVSPVPQIEIIGAIADGGGDGGVDTGGGVTAGAENVNVLISFTNTLTDYVLTSASEIFTKWTAYGVATWGLKTVATHGQVLQTPDNTELPSYFVSNDLLYDGVVEVEIGALESGGDDDFIGMIFRWQDQGNYYLLDWKQMAQTVTGWGAGRTGLVLRAVRNYDFDANGVFPDTIASSTHLWGTQAGRSDILAYWDTGWADNKMYKLRVVLNGPSIKVYVDGVLRMDVIDYTFAGGRYGPYTFSQAYTSIKNLAVYRDTITNETVEVEFPPGWPQPVVGAPPAGNLIGTLAGQSVTSALSVAPVGTGPHGGTLVTAYPLGIVPGQTLTLSFGPVQAPPVPGTQTWYMRTAGVGGVMTPIETQPTVTILPAP